MKLVDLAYAEGFVQLLACYVFTEMPILNFFWSKLIGLFALKLHVLN